MEKNTLKYVDETITADEVWDIVSPILSKYGSHTSELNIFDEAYIYLCGVLKTNKNHKVVRILERLDESKEKYPIHTVEGLAARQGIQEAIDIVKEETNT